MAAELHSQSDLIETWMKHYLDVPGGEPTFREKPIDLKTFLILIIKPTTNLLLRPEQVKNLEMYLDTREELNDKEISDACDVWGVFATLSPIIREMSWGNKKSTKGHPRCDPFTLRQISHATYNTLTPAQIKHIIWVLNQHEWVEIRSFERKRDSGGSAMSVETDISAAGSV